MKVDVSRFHEAFFEESFEGLAVMESGLQLLATSADPEIVNGVFRIIHPQKTLAQLIV